MEIIDQVGSMFAVGPFYYYVVDTRNINLLHVSKGIRNVLGVPSSSFSLELLDDLIHPEDLAAIEKIIEFYSNTQEFELSNYKVSYLIRLKNFEGKYRTILNQSKILGDTIEPEQKKIINIHTDISHLKIEQDFQISFTCSNRPSYHFDLIKKKPIITEKATRNLSERERQVIKLTAEGKKAEEIARLLYISANTVNSHKRNIIKKHESKNMSQLIADLLRQGII
ncbi:LuxR C-terminal-related transcriptional regulator [Salinimicrobium sp. HB62]|uniref:LuxR C-terminal-related transcriptional regulator n=1 Tax=Salinimicrobium sp. HB62 TaxID=3077781 RepID=UPI002D798D4B|nr:LuxR C-terminal-related transcriptional regulator [Salinimicrobium sp. HB62]